VAPLQYILQVALSLPPVLSFLAGLTFLDSYKLVRLRAIMAAILAGCAVAVLSMVSNIGLMNFLQLQFPIYSRYVAPIVEETLKSAYLVYLLKSKRLGFMVDAAIYGFAVGAGFACLENIYYLQTLSDSNMFIWLIRGFGTAIMHGGTTAVFGMLSKGIADRTPSEKLTMFLPGWLIAVGIHSFYNHFFFSPLVSTVVIVLVLPTVMMAVFNKSERSLESWLGVGFDADQELLQLINSGKLSDTPVGVYLQTLQSRFPGEVMMDMICLLRLHLELSILGKGILLMRQAGFEVPPSPDVREKFEELRYLEKSIGTTGKLAIHPFLQASSRDLWQLHMLKEK